MVICDANQLAPVLDGIPSLDAETTQALHILVVEDDRNLNRAIRLRLELAGYRVTCFHDGPELLEYLRQHQGVPDLVLMDVGLPRLSGLTTARTILSSLKTWDIPIVMITGDRSPNVAQCAIEAGARGIVYKPMESQDLLRVIGEHLG